MYISCEQPGQVPTAAILLRGPPGLLPVLGRFSHAQGPERSTTGLNSIWGKSDSSSLCRYLDMARYLVHRPNL